MRSHRAKQEDRYRRRRQDGQRNGPGEAGSPSGVGPSRARRDLVDRGFNVTGIDISEVQIERAQRLVPGGRFICAIMDSS